MCVGKGLGNIRTCEDVQLIVTYLRESGCLVVGNYIAQLCVLERRGCVRGWVGAVRLSMPNGGNTL
jgi:hypothetical protein